MGRPVNCYAHLGLAKSLKGAAPLILVKTSVFFLLENSLHVWGHYVLNFYKAIATRNARKKGPKNGGYR